MPQFKRRVARERQVLIVMLFSCILFVLPVKTAGENVPFERKPGISVGDWVNYGNIHFSWASNTSLDQLPDDFKSFIEMYSELSCWTIAVLEINGTLVTYQSALSFKNGTTTVLKTHWGGQTVNASYVDVATGEDSNMFFVAANLSTGDCIYTEYPDWIISQTVHRVYVGESKEVNIMAHEGEYLVESRKTSYNFNIVWDRPTGALLEWQGSEEVAESNWTASCNFSFLATDMHVTTSEFFPSTILLLLIIATSICIIVSICLIVYREKRVRTRSRKHFFSSN